MVSDFFLEEADGWRSKVWDMLDFTKHYFIRYTAAVTVPSLLYTLHAYVEERYEPEKQNYLINAAEHTSCRKQLFCCHN